MSSGVLVVAELAGGEPRPASLELIGAGRALCEQGAGSLAVAVIAHDAEVHAPALDVAGVEEIVVVSTPCAHFEAHVWQAALEALIHERRPAVVLAGHTVDSLGFVAAAAARAKHGFASDVTELWWDERGLHARRGAYGERLVAELDFPEKDTALALLRAGAFEPTMTIEPHTPRARTTRLDVDLHGRARTERLELREPPGGDVDIAKAEFLLSLGRGVLDGEHVPRLEALAERMGATLSASGPPVEAGWVSRARKVGQSGRTVAPRLYLALGISGAPQHLAGMSRARTIIAVNTDPNARIFDVAHYGAVADLFEVADELEREFG